MSFLDWALERAETVSVDEFDFEGRRVREVLRVFKGTPPPGRVRMLKQ